MQSASGACYAPTEVKRRRTAAERKMSLKRPAAGGEFRKRNSFLYMCEKLVAVQTCMGSVFGGSFCEIRGHQIFIRNPLGQFTCLLQNILQQFEAVLFKNQIFFPGVLGLITVYNGDDIFQRCFLELRLNDLGDLLRSVGIYIVHAFLQCIGEFLDDIRVGVDIASFCTVGSVRNIAGIGSQGCDYIAVALQFQCSGKRFEFYGVVAVVTGKGSCRQTKVYALVDGQVRLGIDAIFL